MALLPSVGLTYLGLVMFIRRCTLILDAFHLQESQLIQLPGWASSEKFNITARAGRPASGEELWTMMRALLEERFRLRAHMEEREGPVYFLDFARPDKKLGPKLVPVSRDCSIDSPIPPQPPSNAAGGSFCGIDSNTGTTRGSIRGGGQRMAQFAMALGTYAVPRPVIDRMGLTGTFDFEVEWVPDTARLANQSAPDGVSIFTAVEESLGVRLESGRGPMQVLVVDNLDRPTPD
jgi:uncharacterized protein (TIGR03435 family)